MSKYFIYDINNHLLTLVFLECPERHILYAGIHCFLIYPDSVILKNVTFDLYKLNDKELTMSVVEWSNWSVIDWLSVIVLVGQTSSSHRREMPITSDTS